MPKPPSKLPVGRIAAWPPVDPDYTRGTAVPIWLAMLSLLALFACAGWCGWFVATAITMAKVCR